MTSTTGRYADFESLREQAIALRREGLSRRQIRDRLRVDNNDILNRLLEGEPAPDWTKRPNAKDDLRARAREMRAQEWDHELQVRDAVRRKTKDDAALEVGALSARELFLVGVSLYWAEGSKDKPYDRREHVIFVNSDTDVIRVYVAWLDLLGIERECMRFRVMIHESADVAAAELHWAEVAGIDTSRLSRTTLKKHNPKTVRKNVGEAYRGCLVISVLQSAELYRRIEGWWRGIASDAQARLG
ncbi:hypothetical protein [Streptomyces sp. NPDC013457]|uniref:hypothetical protein n=1 Tax=Streptomyces sp. NPDC013457 TaxID=3364866 RepID=UPI0036FECA53